MNLPSGASDGVHLPDLKRRSALRWELNPSEIRAVGPLTRTPCGHAGRRTGADEAQEGESRSDGDHDAMFGTVNPDELPTAMRAPRREPSRPSRFGPRPHLFDPLEGFAFRAQSWSGPRPSSYLGGERLASASNQLKDLILRSTRGTDPFRARNTRRSPSRRLTTSESCS